MANSWPTLNFLTSDPNNTDYRPTLNATGDTVIFERTPVPDGGRPTTLQVIDDFSNPDPMPFLSGPAPASQTRPDWCWATGNVLFNGASGNKAPVSVWQVGSNGANPTAIYGTTGAFYPKWNLAGTLFVTENGGGTASPKPCNTIFNLDGTVLTANVDGNDSQGVSMFGGMPAVMSTDLPRIAYAGEPMVPNWNGPNTGIKYNENNNYIFLNQLSGNSFISHPMEQDASVSSFDQGYEGRAPDVSPDGTTIVFESNRPNGGQNYAIYLFSLKTNTLKQVTDPSLNGQHAKFFPDGTKLILTIHHPNNTPPTRGIAWVDISSLL